MTVEGKALVWRGHVSLVGSTGMGVLVPCIFRRECDKRRPTLENTRLPVRFTLDPSMKQRKNLHIAKGPAE